MSKTTARAWMPLFLSIFGILVVTLQLGVVFLLLALLPAMMAWFTDRDKGKPTFKVVAACNLAATLPSLAPILQATLHMRHYDVGPLMGDPANWLYVYSGAAAGWGLVYLCRFIALFVVTLMYEYHAASLENAQKRLVDEWGQQILRPPGE
ncbi:MAG: hypothetical protein KGI29_04990 [Pseudomonadota bacterium]|nr:hypothetical protein [Pseudomonadota bacterium]MDE3037604.1 hypothetical protein [Pseudomonadota bacterium]